MGNGSYQTAEGLPFGLQGSDDAQYKNGSEHAAVRIEEITEIVVAGKFSAPDSVDLAEFPGGKGAAHLPCLHPDAHRFEELAHGLRAPDVLKHQTLLSPLLHEILSEHCDDQVRRHKVSFIIDEHHPVGITVIDHTDIGPGLPDQSFERLDILVDERVRLVVREGSVDFIEYVGMTVTEYFAGEKAGHSV